MIAFTAKQNPTLGVKYQSILTNTVFDVKIVDNTELPRIETKAMDIAAFTMMSGKDKGVHYTYATSIDGSDLTPVIDTKSVLSFTMRSDPTISGKLVSNVKDTFATSTVKKNVASGTITKTEVTEAISTVVRTVADGGFGDTTGTFISNVDIVLEVQRYKVFRFNFPEGMLNGIKLVSGVTQQGHQLRVEMKDYGQKILYVDVGTITIRCLPGFRKE